MADERTKAIDLAFAQIEKQFRKDYHRIAGDRASSEGGRDGCLRRCGACA